MNPWKGLNTLPRNMWTLFFTSLINRVGTMVIPFLTIYLTTREGFSPADAGLVIAFYGAGALVTAPLSGKLSDKIGPLLLMKLSLIITGVLFFVYSFINQFYLILGLTFILAVINESFRPANLSIISQIVPPKQRRTAFALNRLAVNLGMSIGPIVGGMLALISFHLIFYVDGITCILAGMFLALSKWQSVEINPEEGEDENHLDEIIHSHVLKDKRFIYILLAILPIPIIYFQNLGAYPLFLVNDLGFATSIYGLLFAINTVLIILIEVPLNNSMSKWSERKSMRLGAILIGIGFGAMAFANGLIFIIITIVIWTFGEMIFFPVTTSYISSIAPEKKRGEYMGYYQMTFSTAFLIGPWLGTLVFEYYGSVILWTGTFVLSLITILLLLKPDSLNLRGHI